MCVCVSVCVCVCLCLCLFLFDGFSSCSFCVVVAISARQNQRIYNRCYCFANGSRTAEVCEQEAEDAMVTCMAPDARTYKPSDAVMIQS